MNLEEIIAVQGAQCSAGTTGRDLIAQLYEIVGRRAWEQAEARRDGGSSPVEGQRKGRGERAANMCE